MRNKQGSVTGREAKTRNPKWWKLSLKIAVDAGFEGWLFPQHTMDMFIQLSQLSFLICKWEKQEHVLPKSSCRSKQKNPPRASTQPSTWLFQCCLFFCSQAERLQEKDVKTQKVCVGRCRQAGFSQK